MQELDYRRDYSPYSFPLESVVCCISLNMPLFNESFVFNNSGNCVAIGNPISC
jgi:hypothetical protein